MNRLILAFKAFVKAWKYPDQAERFLNSTDARTQDTGADTSHLRLLSLLQHSGRLVDFLKEDIGSFTDAQIGAAARKIHEECSKSLEDLITIRPVMLENEGTPIKVPAGYDPASIKVVGNVRGNPPFSGILIHKGWKAHKRSLPKNISDETTDVICPAEVEVK